MYSSNLNICYLFSFTEEIVHEEEIAEEVSSKKRKINEESVIEEESNKKMKTENEKEEKGIEFVDLLTY